MATSTPFPFGEYLDVAPRPKFATDATITTLISAYEAALRDLGTAAAGFDEGYSAGLAEGLETALAAVLVVPADALAAHNRT